MFEKAHLLLVLLARHTIRWIWKSYKQMWEQDKDLRKMQETRNTFEISQTQWGVRGRRLIQIFLTNESSIFAEKKSKRQEEES